MSRTREELQAEIDNWHSKYLKCCKDKHAVATKLIDKDWDYVGIEADIDSLVNNIRKATDLKELKELTEMNYPDKKEG